MKKRHPRRIIRRLYFSFDRVGGSSQFQWDSTAAVFSGLVIGMVMCLMALLMLTYLKTLLEIIDTYLILLLLQEE